MIFTVLTIDIQVLGSPDYCMGPNEERSLTVRNNTTSGLSKRVVETEASSSSSAIKRSPSQAFPLSSLQLEEREAKRIRESIMRGKLVKDLPDGSIEDINAAFQPTVTMSFNRVPAEIPPTVSLVASDSSLF